MLSNSDGHVFGSTRYLDVNERHRGVEIRWICYSPGSWGTVVNPDCKLPLLGDAFHGRGTDAVQLKTDDRDLHSQRATLKLGAKFEELSGAISYAKTGPSSIPRCTQ